MIHPAAEHLQGSGAEPKGVETEDPYVLFVGDRLGYKNFATLVAAVAERGWPRQVNLKVVGTEFSEPEHRLLHYHGIEAKVIHAGRVTDAELKQLYQRASAFVFPSLCEGFGFPFLEAQHLGVPVLASDIPVFREIGGDSVTFFNPRDPQAIIGAMVKLLEPGRAGGSVSCCAAGKMSGDLPGKMVQTKQRPCFATRQDCGKKSLRTGFRKIDTPMIKRRVIALVDPVWGGHSPTYFSIFWKILEQMQNVEVVGFCPHPNDAREYLKSREIEDPAIHELQLNAMPARKPGVVAEARQKLARWKCLASSLRRTEIDGAAKIDMAVIIWLEPFIARYTFGSLVDRFVSPILWVGLYLHPYPFRIKSSRRHLVRNALFPEYAPVLARRCKAVLTLDEGIVSEMCRKMGKPVLG